MHEKQITNYLTNVEKPTVSWNSESQTKEGSSSKKRSVDEEFPEPELSKRLKIYDIPTPFCSCTGTPRKCHQWGYGGWESTCCNAVISEYPLPVDPKPRYHRIKGRKMNPNRFKKLIEQLKFEGYDLSNAIDLKDHWKKLGLSRFFKPPDK